jgi:hypothetical protein
MVFAGIGGDLYEGFPIIPYDPGSARFGRGRSQELGLESKSLTNASNTR